MIKTQIRIRNQTRHQRTTYLSRHETWCKPLSLHKYIEKLIWRASQQKQHRRNCKKICKTCRHYQESKPTYPETQLRHSTHQERCRYQSSPNTPRSCFYHDDTNLYPCGRQTSTESAWSTGRLANNTKSAHHPPHKKNFPRNREVKFFLTL